VGKNSGLGLSISREIVGAYGGEIWARNIEAEADKPIPSDEEPGPLKDRRVSGVTGARFIVRLPAADVIAAKGAQLHGRRI
jgi:signal transduction histidine kinase